MTYFSTFLKPAILPSTQLSLLGNCVSIVSYSFPEGTRSCIKQFSIYPLAVSFGYSGYMTNTVLRKGRKVTESQETGKERETK